MIRINLLPHREEKRRERRLQFYLWAASVGLVACVVIFIGYFAIASYISSQEDKNDFLKQEISVLDKQIEQIKRLKEQTQALLARKQIIESLQRDRAEAVRLLSEIAKQMPEGVYLRALKQEGQKISLGGYAQSNARVSNLMRNIEASPWLESPQLIEVKAITVDKRRLNEFTMTAVMKRVSADSVDKKAGAKSAELARELK